MIKEKVLSLSKIYSGFQNIIIKPGTRQELISAYLRPARRDRVLDIGCGPADILSELPDVDYVGVDFSANYIAAAQRRYGSSGRFYEGDATELASIVQGPFDLIMAIGVLHHLKDNEVERLLPQARDLLAPGGRIVTVDPAFAPDQSAIARFIISRDRGHHVRSIDAYERLMRRTFANVACACRSDLLRVPYTHLIMEASVPV